jgi:hypothetical protein
MYPPPLAGGGGGGRGGEGGGGRGRGGGGGAAAAAASVVFIEAAGAFVFKEYNCKLFSMNTTAAAAAAAIDGPSTPAVERLLRLPPIAPGV